MSDKQIKIGGFSYKANDVARSKVTKDANGKNTYSVWLKNGVKLEYPQQASGGVSGIWEHGFIIKDKHTTVNGLKDGVITGSDNNDHMSLYNCEGVTVDLRDKEQPSLLDGDKLSLHQSNRDVTVKSDSADEITYYDKDGTRQEFDRPGLDFHKK